MKRFIIPGVLFLVIGVIVSGTIIGINMRQSEVRKQAVMNEVAQQTQLAELVAQELTAQPTATPNPTATFTPVPSPTPSPTPVGGGSGRILNSYDKIKEDQRSYEIYRNTITDLEGNIVFDNSTIRDQLIPSPNGKWFAYGDEQGIHAFQLDGEIRDALSTNINTKKGYIGLYWFSDNERLLVTFHEGLVMSQYAEYIMLDFYVVNMVDKTYSPVVTQVNANAQPLFSLSPDEKQIVYRKSDNKSYISSLDGSSTRYIVDSKFKIPFWSADGSRLLWPWSSDQYLNPPEKIIGIDPVTLQSGIMLEGNSLGLRECEVFKKSNTLNCGNKIIHLDSNPATIMALQMPPNLPDDVFVRKSWISPNEDFLLIEYQTHQDDITNSLYDLKTGEMTVLDFIISDFNPWSPDGKLLLGVKPTDGEQPSDSIIFNVETRQIISTIHHYQDGSYPIITWISTPPQ
jgi:hypothetical protein